MPGFSEGLAICEPGENMEIIRENDFYHWKENDVYFLVNRGSLEDPRVDELIQYSFEYCEEFYAKN